MRTLTLKGIPEKLYRRLKRRAAEHGRSLNREVLICLERAVGTRRLDPEGFLARADALRQRLALPPLNERGLRAAKSAGRP